MKSCIAIAILTYLAALGTATPIREPIFPTSSVLAPH